MSNRKKIKKTKNSNKKLPKKKVTEEPIPKNNPKKIKNKNSGFSSNNFNHIRSLLWKEYFSDFKSYHDPEFLKIVKSVYDECRVAGRDCSDEIILEIYNEVSLDKKRPYPYIRESLYKEVHFYWEIKNIEFDAFPSYLWIKSPMIIPKPSEFIAPDYYQHKIFSIFFKKIKRGRKSYKTKNKSSERIYSRIIPAQNEETAKTKLKKSLKYNIEIISAKERRSEGYNRYFSEWIDWCNEALRKRLGPVYESDKVNLCFTFTKPSFNKKLERWETEIYICTPSGEIDNFGFIPKGKSSDHDVELEYVQPTEKTKITEEQKIIKQKELADLIKSLRKKLKYHYKKIKKEQLAIKERELKIKSAELRRLLKIKKSIEETITLFYTVKDKERVKIALNELDKINKLIYKLKK